MAAKKKKQEKPVEPEVVEMDESGARTVKEPEPYIACNADELTAQEALWKAMSDMRADIGPMTPEQLVEREYPNLGQNIPNILKAILHELVVRRIEK